MGGVRSGEGVREFEEGRGVGLGNPQIIHRAAQGLWKSFGGVIPSFATKFFRFLDSHDDARGSRSGFDVAAAPKNLHPALERLPGETRLLFDLAIADRTPAENEADPSPFARLTKHQPAVEPHGLAHAGIVSRFEEHAAKACIVVFPAHLIRDELPHFQHTPQ